MTDNNTDASSTSHTNPLPHAAEIYRASAQAVLLLVADGLCEEGGQVHDDPKGAAAAIYAATQLLECADIAEGMRRGARDGRRAIA